MMSAKTMMSHDEMVVPTTSSSSSSSCSGTTSRQTSTTASTGHKHLRHGSGAPGGSAGVGSEKRCENPTSKSHPSKPHFAKALFQTPGPSDAPTPSPAGPQLGPAAFEVARLRIENQKLKAKLAELRPSTAQLSKELFSVTSSHSIRRISLSSQCAHDSARVLDAIPKDRPNELVQNMVTVFSHRRYSEAYTNSESFGLDLIQLARQAAAAFAQEDRLLHLSSPVYVFGDIHGNLKDLHFFSDNLWSFGLNLTAGNFLFLGDYVDRGAKSLECIAYLFALKLSCPNKMTMLRGNHELRRVNGWEAWYGSGSFKSQCKSRFGVDLGLAVWEEVNKAFDNMPLAAVVDETVFCTHGGVPRPVPVPPSLAVKAPRTSGVATPLSASSVEMSTPGSTSTFGRSPRTPRMRPLETHSMAFSPPDLRLQAIAAAPVPLPLMAVPTRVVAPSPVPWSPTRRGVSLDGSAIQHGGEGSGSARGSAVPGSAQKPPLAATDMHYVSEETATRVALDLMWADPASEEQETNGHLDAEGFGVGIRGGDTICFGAKAVEDFLKANNFQLMIRAHQATSHGVSVTKAAQVVTVFSTSKDHGCGPQATCGCVLIEGGKVIPIARAEPIVAPPAAVAATPPASVSRTGNSDQDASNSTNVNTIPRSHAPIHPPKTATSSRHHQKLFSNGPIRGDGPPSSRVAPAATRESGTRPATAPAPPGRASQSHGTGPSGASPGSENQQAGRHMASRSERHNASYACTEASRRQRVPLSARSNGVLEETKADGAL